MDLLTQIKNRLLQLGYVAQTADESALSFLITKVENEIKVFCNITEIPDELTEGMIDRICGEYLNELLATGKLTGFDFEKGVKSVTEGDSSFTFADDDSAETKFSKIILQMVHGLDEQLIAFRKMRW